MQYKGTFIKDVPFFCHFFEIPTYPCPILSYLQGHTQKRTSYFGKHAEFETEREANTTVFPHIASCGNYSFLNLENQRSHYIRPKVTVQKCVEIIQGRKLYEEIRYLYKLEICLRPSFPGIQSCIMFTDCKVSNSLFSIHGMVDALASVQTVISVRLWNFKDGGL